MYLTTYISHFHPIPFKYGKSSNLTRCRLSDDLWAAKKDGRREKSQNTAATPTPACLRFAPTPSPPPPCSPPRRPWKRGTCVAGSNFPPPPLSARYRLGRTKRRQHQNQAVVSWPPLLSLYKQPHRRLTCTHTHRSKKDEANGCC